MYIPGLTEILIVKGIAWISAHMGTVALHHLAAYAVAHGVIATVTTLAPIVIGGSFAVGGVIWVGEKLELVNGLMKDIGDHDVTGAAAKLIKIASTLHSSYVDAGDAVSNLLTHYYGDTGEIHQVCSTIKDIAQKIKK